CRSECSDLVVCIDVNLTRSSYRIVNVADIRAVADTILTLDIFADVDVTVASDEIVSGRSTDGRVVATGALKERLRTNSGVGFAAGIVVECIHTKGGVEAAGLVVVERFITGSRVPEAGGVIFEHGKTGSRIVAAGG